MTLVATQITHWALSAATPWRLRSGPYGLLAANFVSFVTEIPPTQRFPVFGIQLNDKASLPVLPSTSKNQSRAPLYTSSLSQVLLGYETRLASTLGPELPSTFAGSCLCCWWAASNFGCTLLLALFPHWGPCWPCLPNQPFWVSKA